MSTSHVLARDAESAPSGSTRRVSLDRVRQTFIYHFKDQSRHLGSFSTRPNVSPWIASKRRRRISQARQRRLNKSGPPFWCPKEHSPRLNAIRVNFSESISFVYTRMQESPPAFSRQISPTVLPNSDEGCAPQRHSRHVF